ncbi:hypothetical protein E2C01_019630 [Portunus trituberculatus]|uniref:Uncharacterized protein n=1 Tax=Portunus trituberculatus TaxID=210409 RepID=A0A5B7DY52_PORTR|nr:hypothetical protein [Portunus trituberculatus]
MCRSQDPPSLPLILSAAKEPRRASVCYRGRHTPQTPHPAPTNPGNGSLHPLSVFSPPSSQHNHMEVPRQRKRRGVAQ